MNIFYSGIDSAVGNELAKLGAKPLSCDITDADSIVKAVESVVRPDVVINLAGKSDPDFCEKKENANIVIKTNVRGAFNLATVCETLKIPVVFLSTDHVFDGKRGPYRENDKLTVPVNFYGSSKLAMEAIGSTFQNVKIVRTSYLFNYKRATAVPEHGYPTFFNRSFMYLPHFAKALYVYAIKFAQMPKILHISGSETINWYEFGLSTGAILGWDRNGIKYRKKELKDYNGAPRPHKAGLNVVLSRKLGLPQFSYLEGLRGMKQDHVIKELYG